MYEPGEPEKRERAGTTVFGGTMVLSEIFAQSLMIVNFPLIHMRTMTCVAESTATYDDTVLPNFNMVANLSCFHNGVGANVNMVTDFHWVIVEVSSICLVWRAWVHLSVALDKRQSAREITASRNPRPPDSIDPGISRRHGQVQFSSDLRV